MDLVLASASPRRLAILRMLGLEPRVESPGVAEPRRRAIDTPERYAVDVARLKLASTRSGAGEVALAADTVVVLDGEVLGKPCDPEHARAMLTQLVGREHEVITGVAVRARSAEAVGFERTRVTFRPADVATVTSYVATGQPLDKAGAYGIQDRGAILIERVDGCFYNVMGLPIARTLALLRELGIGYDPAAGALVGVSGGSTAAVGNRNA